MANMESIIVSALAAGISSFVVACLTNSKSKKKHLRNEVDKIQKEYPLACKAFLTKNSLTVKNANIKTLKKITQRSKAVWRKEEDKLQSQENDRIREVQDQQSNDAREKQKRREESTYAVVNEKENVSTEQEGAITQNEMQRLLQLSASRKKDWEKYKQVLHDNGIHRFYHFTDEQNLQSIRDCGGLFS